eukprot:gene18315-25784_t
MQSELINLFENTNNITSFERKRRIYDLTNNLDKDLLLDLKKEFYTFYAEKIKEKEIDEICKKNENIQNRINHIKKTISNQAEAEKIIYTLGNIISVEELEKLKRKPVALENILFSLNFMFDEFLDKYDYSIIEDIIEKTSVFIYDLDELISRANEINKANKISKANEISKVIKIIEPRKEHISVKEKEEPIDMSDTSITSKIIYLEKLGIISFLRKQEPFSTSVNSMATAISAITGGKSTTIQSMLNPMLSTEVDGKNNPMNSNNTVR